MLNYDIIKNLDITEKKLMNLTFENTLKNAKSPKKMKNLKNRQKNDKIKQVSFDVSESIESKEIF